MYIHLQAPWWPAMVLAAGEGKVVPYTSPSVGTINISRIPYTIAKQLVKLKAKFQLQNSAREEKAAEKAEKAEKKEREKEVRENGGGGEKKGEKVDKMSKELKSLQTTNTVPTPFAEYLTVPDGYALLEFFGTHDFGW